MRWSCNSSRICVLPVAGLLTLLPSLLSSGNLGGRGFLGPHPLSASFLQRIRDGVVERLDLTEQQLDEIRASVDSHREALLEEISKLEGSRRALMDQIRSEIYDEAAIRRAHRVACNAELELALHTGRTLREVRAHLTPEQRLGANDLVAELRKGAEGRFVEFEKHFR